MIPTGDSRGRFITVEGTDGAGKSTQLEFIRSSLAARHIDCLVTREPGGSPLGEALRDVLLGQSQLAIDPGAQLLIVFAARVQHLKEVIFPALEQGRWVLCDRFTDASYAYQGGAGGLGFSAVETIENWVQGDFRPDLTLLLDVPLETGLARSTSRNGEKDRFESASLEFKRLVRDAYLKLADLHPERIRLIDARGDINSVSSQLETEITDFIRRCKNTPG